MRRDSTASTATLPPLEYLHASPIRGQLEPSDEATKKTGWRFLQCTDTPNELKVGITTFSFDDSQSGVLQVLLPPRTQLYARLLKAEKSELAKKLDASWDRILEIRHLKDRMIRKCQRLAHSYSASKPSAKVPFLSIHAPLDFRLKEMEKFPWATPSAHAIHSAVIAAQIWFLINTPYLVVHPPSLPIPVAQQHTSDHSTSKALPASPRRARSSKASSIQSDHKPSPVASSIILNESHSHHQSQSYESRVHESIHQEAMDTQVHATFTAHENRFDDHSSTQESRVRDSSNIRTRQHKHSRSMSYDARRFAETGLHEITRAMHVIPEASEVGTDPSNCSAAMSASKLSIISPEPLPHPYHGSTSAVFLNMVESPVAAPQVQSIESGYVHLAEDEGVSTPPSEDEPTSDSPPQPNTLRRRSSLKRSNNDLRLMALEVHQSIRETENGMPFTLTRLRLEAEKLQREDEVIRDQEDKLRAGYKQLEQKHGQYREKVKAVLEETEQVLTLCGTKRDS
ncbi:hypothetical protein EV424DRAFT_1532597 [Suillus variegatus]|nr:hypothetical protein EV424DRAFT_1532597 [Suillus variegatus]